VITLKKKPGVILLAFLLMSTFFVSAVNGAIPSAYAAVPTEKGADDSSNKTTAYNISSIKWEQTAESFILRVKGDSSPTYTMYELFDPLRIIIDIADASMEAGVSLPLDLPHGPVSLVNGKVLEDKEPFIARVELFLDEDISYTVERLDNDVVVRFAKAIPDQQQLEDTTTQVAENEPAQQTETASPLGINEEIFAPAEVETAIESAIEPAMQVVDQIQSAPAQVAIASDNASILFDIEVEHKNADTYVYLKADGTIRDYRKVELNKDIEANRPYRMYLDVKDVNLAGPIEPKQVGTSLAQIRTAKRKDGFRIVFDSGLENLFDYTISERSDGLLITIKEPSAATAVIAGLLQEITQEQQTPEVAPEPQIMEDPSAIDINEIDLALEPLQPQIPAPDTADTKTAKASASAAKTASGSGLDFSGYTKQRITVDFYKIDLHNVFRLFGEISNLNMVVDESVAGSLTLALNDVPWDFALDIILNLKDLQKEERFNTIVISPKEKEFKWPERTLDSIEFKADLDVEVQQDEQESIQINKRQQFPETVVEAKKLIHQAQTKERIGNYPAALPLYEDAFSKWPDNQILAKRIANLCLVNLNQNAKAIHYAKTALQLNPADSDAALQAAIGSARMKKNDQAREYFNLATSGSRPSSESLGSYAAFCEESQDYDCAMAMLKRHEDFHGDTLQTMISKARIHDKQGQSQLAVEEYRAILLSGYGIPPDLARYINGRVSLSGQ